MLNSIPEARLILPYLSKEDNPQIISKPYCKDEVIGVDSELTCFNAVELPYDFFFHSGLDISSMDDIPEVIDALLPQHDAKIPFSRRRAYDALRMHKGDCIDRLCAAVALARLNGLEARAVGFTEKLLQKHWDKIYPLFPSTNGRIVYHDGSSIGIIAEYNSACYYVGNLPKSEVPDNAVKINALSYMLVWGLVNSHMKATKGKKENLSENVPVDFSTPLERYQHCWYEIKNGNGWKHFHNQPTDNPFDIAVVEGMREARKELIEIGFKSNKPYILN
jgi:hypothetical protein